MLSMREVVSVAGDGGSFTPSRCRSSRGYIRSLPSPILGILTRTCGVERRKTDQEPRPGSRMNRTRSRIRGYTKLTYRASVGNYMCWAPESAGMPSLACDETASARGQHSRGGIGDSTFDQARRRGMVTLLNSCQVLARCARRRVACRKASEQEDGIAE